MHISFKQLKLLTSADDLIGRTHLEYNQEEVLIG